MNESKPYLKCGNCGEFTGSDPCWWCRTTPEERAKYLFKEYFKKSKAQDIQLVFEIIKRLYDETDPL